MVHRLRQAVQRPLGEVSPQYFLVHQLDNERHKYVLSPGTAAANSSTSTASGCRVEMNHDPATYLLLNDPASQLDPFLIQSTVFICMPVNLPCPSIEQLNLNHPDILYVLEKY